MKNSLLEAQKNCTLEIDSCNEKENYQEQIEELQFEKLRLENLVVKIKMEFIDEKVFLQEELRINEDSLINLKIKHAESTLEAERYKMKYKAGLKKIKLMTINKI